MTSSPARSLFLAVMDKAGEIVFTVAVGGPICLLSSGAGWWLFRWAAGWL